MTESHQSLTHAQRMARKRAIEVLDDPITQLVAHRADAPERTAYNYLAGP